MIILFVMNISQSNLNPITISKMWSYTLEETKSLVLSRTRNLSISQLDNIIPAFIKKYSNDNNLELVELNILEKSFDSKYWAISLKTNQLFAFNTNTINNYNRILKELGYNSFNFIELTIILDDTNNYSDKIIKYNNFNYRVIICKTIQILFDDLSNNISNRDARYIRRDFIKKRKNSEPIESLPKKNKQDDDINNNLIVSASSVRNYMLKDPLLDWLKEYNITSLTDKPNRFANKIVEIDIFTKHIMEAGIQFENELIAIIKKSHKVHQVSYNGRIDSRSKSKFEQTKFLMKRGVPIIYQGVLHGTDNTFGVPDLIVRCDYLNKLMGYEVVSETNKFYRVIDIKHSNIELSSDGTHILNSGSVPAYKAQLMIYNNILNQIQGDTNQISYIWGKKYSWIKQKEAHTITNFLNKLGQVDFNNYDYDYNDKVKKAIEWIIRMKTNGEQWKLLPKPSVIELYPNMKNEKDGFYRNVKNELNKELKDITSLWSSGVIKRDFAFSKNIYRWDDPRCNSDILGMGGTKKGDILDKILSINRQSKDLIRPKKFTFDKEHWNKNNKYFDFYLDFETLNSNFGSIIRDGIIMYDENQFIFMIGCGYSIAGKWIFKQWILKSKTIEDEKTMWDAFYNWVNSILKKYQKPFARFFHWSHAEPSIVKKFLLRHNERLVNYSNWTYYDIYKIFVNTPIVVKDALNYSLKSIGKALYNSGLIKTSWDGNSPCGNGLQALIIANNLYEKYITITPDNSTMKEIGYYNEVDCKVLYEIHNLLIIHK